MTKEEMILIKLDQVLDGYSDIKADVSYLRAKWESTEDRLDKIEETQEQMRTSLALLSVHEPSRKAKLKSAIAPTSGIAAFIISIIVGVVQYFRDN